MKMDLLPVVVVSARDGNLKARIFFFLSGDTQKMWNFRHECQRTEKKFFTRKDKFLVILTYRAIGEELIDIKI